MSIEAEHETADLVGALAPFQQALLVAAATPGVTVSSIAMRCGCPASLGHREITAAMTELRASSPPATGATTAVDALDPPRRGRR